MRHLVVVPGIVVEAMEAVPDLESANAMMNLLFLSNYTKNLRGSSWPKAKPTFSVVEEYLLVQKQCTLWLEALEIVILGSFGLK